MKKIIITILMFVSLLFIPSCNEGKIYDGEYIIEIKYKIYQNKLDNLDNFIGFIADKNDLKYTAANNLINNYYKYYSDINIYRLDITKDENGKYTDKTLTNEKLSNLSASLLEYNCNNLANCLVLYNNGSIYRAFNLDEIIYKDKSQVALYNFINNFYEYSISISCEIDQSLKEIIEITKEDAKNKYDNQDDFLLFIAQKQCSACSSCKPNLDSYIQNTKKKIYILYLESGDKEYLQENLNINIEYTPTFVTFKSGKLANLYIGCYNDSQLNTILINESQSN